MSADGDRSSVDAILTSRISAGRKQRASGTLTTRQPLLYAALEYGAGIAMASFCWRPVTWLFISALVFAVSACCLLHRRDGAARVLATGLWFWLGAINFQLKPSPHIPDIAKFTDRNQVTVSGYVVHEGYLREGGFGGIQQQIDLETERIETASDSLNATFRIRLSILIKNEKQTQDNAVDDLPLYHYGQHLRVVTKLRQPRNYGNAGSFDYRGYLQEQGIMALGSAKAEEVELLQGFAGSRFEAARSQVHRRLIEKIHILWPPQQAALMDAAVIGEDAFVNRDTRADFQRSGTYHILVVSGMNVSILAFVSFWTFRRLRICEIPASILTTMVALSYAFLTDVGPPVWRATLMMSCYLGTRLLYREKSMLNALGAAALSLMVVQPREFVGASFQLTFLSVLIVAALAIPMLERTAQPYRRSLRHLETLELDAALPPPLAQFRLDIRLVASRLGRFTGRRFGTRFILISLGGTLALAEVLLVSALMQVGLALPMAWYFHRVTIVALPANIVAVPLTELLMPAAVAALTLSFLKLSLARLPALIAGLALEGITTTVHELGKFSISDLRVASPQLWLALSASMALAISMILVRKRPLLAWAGIGGLVATAVGIATVSRPHFQHGVVEVTSIDVGQGDSTLLVSPQGRTILVDAGGMPGSGHSNFDIGEDVVSPYLWSRGFSHLDVVMISHGHWDHVGGMWAVVNNFRPRELWVGVNSPTSSLQTLIEYANQHHMRVKYLGAGDQISLGGIDLRVLAPAKDDQHRRPNDDCLAFKLTVGQTSLLMEGDAEKSTEKEIVRQSPSAELLKVGHHGSATSTSEALLAAVHPRIAMISVGRDNSYGHPRYEVLQRLGGAGVNVYRTDLDGLTTFYLDGNSISPVLR